MSKSKRWRLIVLFAILGFAVYIAESAYYHYQNTHSPYAQTDRETASILLLLNPASIVGWILAEGGEWWRQPQTMRSAITLELIFALLNAAIYATFGAALSFFLWLFDALRSAG